jgi:glycosyltransferase involved in cell wall biosynthesis
MPVLTVLIATHNGAQTLPHALKEYCNLEPPKGGWKLIIIDNASTDETKEIVASYEHCLPLTYLYEPRQGKNIALNLALPKVLGDLVVFTDDDTLPEPAWLRLFREAADAHPSFTIFGGPILPKWKSPPEKWITMWVPLGPTFAILNPLEEGPIPPRSVFGPNMAIRANIFERGYRFDETIGPKGTNYAMGSETELLRRLARGGFQAWHCRGAVVQHIIRSSQMNVEWVLTRAVRYGRGQYRMSMPTCPSQRFSLFGIPISLLLQIALQRLRIAKAKWRRHPEHIFKERWRLNYLYGQAIEARLLTQERRCKLETLVHI